MNRGCRAMISSPASASHVATSWKRSETLKVERNSFLPPEYLKILESQTLVGSLRWKAKQSGVAAYLTDDASWVVCAVHWDAFRFYSRHVTREAWSPWRRDVMPSSVRTPFWTRTCSRSLLAAIVTEEWIVGVVNVFIHRACSQGRIEGCVEDERWYS